MTWLATIGALLEESEQRPQCACHVGHESHVVTLADTDQGPMVVFDAAQYLDIPDYCQGDDDVSRTLIGSGRWEQANTNAFLKGLSHARGKLVIDIGAHVGWYSCLAVSEDFDLLAIEASFEHHAVLTLNIHNRLSGAGGELASVTCWIDENTPVLPASGAPMVAMVKIDIEGNERHAIGMLGRLLAEGLIENILMEVSPCFNDSYGPLVKYLINDLGFTAALIGPKLEPFSAGMLDILLAERHQFDIMLSLNPNWWSK